MKSVKALILSSVVPCLALIALSACTVRPYAMNPYSGGVAYYSMPLHYSYPSPVKCRFWVPFSCRPKTAPVPYGYGGYSSPYDGDERYQAPYPGTAVVQSEEPAYPYPSNEYPYPTYQQSPEEYGSGYMPGYPTP